MLGGDVVSSQKASFDILNAEHLSQRNAVLRVEFQVHRQQQASYMYIGAFLNSIEVVYQYFIRLKQGTRRQCPECRSYIKLKTKIQVNEEGKN